LNVHRVSVDRQIEIHTAEPLVPDSSPFEDEIAVSELKRYKWPDNGQSPAKKIQSFGGRKDVSTEGNASRGATRFCPVPHTVQLACK
jgi:hypothetical protein